MIIDEIVVKENGRVLISFSNGSVKETPLDSTCIGNLDVDEYNALVNYIENETESYFAILNEIKNLY